MNLNALQLHLELLFVVKYLNPASPQVLPGLREPKASITKKHKRTPLSPSGLRVPAASASSNAIAAPCHSP